MKPHQNLLLGVLGLKPLDQPSILQISQKLDSILSPLSLAKTLADFPNPSKISLETNSLSKYPLIKSVYFSLHQ